MDLELTMGWRTGEWGHAALVMVGDRVVCLVGVIHGMLVARLDVHDAG